MSHIADHVQGYKVHSSSLIVDRFNAPINDRSNEQSSYFFAVSLWQRAYLLR